MTSLAVSKDDWSVLAPLVDRALDLPPETREQWIAEQTQLNASLQSTLRAMLAAHDSPETLQLLNPDAVVDLRHAAMQVQKQSGSGFAEGHRIGPYRLVRLLGRGGMGEVWAAERVDGAFGRTVALKICDPADSPRRVRERLNRERDVLASLEHPSIARFYDAGVDDTGTSYIAMELIDGVPLNVHLTNRELDERASCHLMLEVLGAVQYAHQHLIVHRDLKPGNVMVRSDGKVSLLDFGIAKILDPETRAGEATQLTQEAGRALTPGYASPEQCRGDTVSTATDVFSAGVILYELLAGERPFKHAEQNLVELCRAQAAPLARIAKIKNRSWSRDLNAIVARALREQPSDRYQSAAEFAEDLRRFLGNEPVLAVRGARWYVFSKFVRRHVAAVVVASVAALGFLGFVALLSVQYQESERLRQRAQTVERVMSGVFAGLNPSSSDAQLALPKELLDRSVDTLGQTAEDPAIAVRLAAIYRHLKLPDSALAVLERSRRRIEATQSRDVTSESTVLAATAILLADQRQFARAEAVIEKARELLRWSWLGATEARWQYLVASGQVKLAKGALVDAARDFDAARQVALRMGNNELDALTTTIDLQAELARRNGDWNRTLQLLAEADNAAGRFGEVDPVLSPTRALAKAKARLAIGDLPTAITLLEPHFEDSARRYPFGHINRMESGLLLSHALLRAGEAVRAEEVRRKLMPLHPHVLAERGFLGFFTDMQKRGRMDRNIGQRMMESLFLSSVIRNRSDLRLIDARNELLRIGWPMSQASADASVAATRSDTLGFMKAMIAPRRDAASHLALNAKDRARLALGYAQLLVNEGQLEEATGRLAFATDFLDDDNTGDAIDLDETRLTRAVVHLRRQEFAEARRLLESVQKSFAATLPPDAPRAKLAAFYTALVELGETTPAVTSEQRLRDCLDALGAGSASRVNTQRLEQWLSERGSGIHWATLPLIVL